VITQISNSNKMTSQPTIVLVHGAYVDASSWNGVIERLQHLGYNRWSKSSTTGSAKELGSGRICDLATVLRCVELTSAVGQGPVVARS
jgi:hypothetical protein